MFKNKQPVEKSTSLKFSVTQEKHSRDIDTLLETCESLQEKVDSLSNEVEHLKKQMKNLIDLSTVKPVAAVAH